MSGLVFFLPWKFMNYSFPSQLFLYFTVGMLGLAVGSFLNVVAWRLPRNESIVFPASHCPLCGETILPWYNIPVLGYLLLGGKCNNCKGKISPIYPAVEIITSLMFLYLFSLHHFNIRFISDCLLGSMLIVVIVTDIQHMIIPNRLLFPTGIFGFILSFFSGYSGMIRSFSGACVGVLVMLIMALLGRILFKRDSLGWGDVKLSAVTGLFLGPVWNLIALVLAIFIGGTWGMILIALKKTKPGDEIPFGPFIAAGCFIVLFFRLTILSLISKYLSFF